MTLAQFKIKVQPSFDTRTKIGTLEIDLKAQQDLRDQMDVPTEVANDQVVKAVVADVNYGDDSALYERMGYVRKSVRASGLTRKNKAAANAVKKS
jgi:hypothetical protein